MIYTRRSRGALKAAIRKVLTDSPVPHDGQVPAELLRHIPREVRLSGLGWVVAGMIPVLLVLAIGVGIAMHRNLDKDRKVRNALKVRGTRVEASISRIESRKEGQRRTVSYEYLVDGQTFKSQVRLHKGDKRTVEQGSTISVRYLPENPGKSWVIGYEPGGVPWVVVWVLSGGIAAIGLVLAAVIRREQRFLSEGRPAVARITKALKGHEGHGTECEFQAFSGAVRRLKLTLAKTLPVGSLITILYDKDNLRRGIAYPTALVRLAKH